MIRLLFLVGVVWAATLPASPTWEIVRVGRVDYVSLKSFAKFYGFTIPEEIEPNRPFVLGSAYGNLTMTLESREMRWKGVRYWLSHSLRRVDDEVLVPRVDLVKTFDPLLRPNAEIAKRPLQGVVIDPGHGGGDEGTRAARGLSEKTANLDVGKRLAKLLDAAGIPWVLTRNKDRYLDHADRSKLADDRPGFIFVSIHFNEDSSRSTDGWETYSLSPQYAPSTSSGGTLVGDEDEIWAGNSYDHHNFLLTQAIHRAAVTAKTNAPNDRGVKRARFKVLRLANSPSVLVEGGFMSNPRESSLMRTEAYRQQVAEWIFQGIVAYQKSQETLPSGTRLSVVMTNKVSSSTPELRPVMNLDSVPPYRPKVASTNPSVATNQSSGTNPAATAQSIDGEVRRAVPVIPDKKAN